MVVMAPKDENELRHMLATVVAYTGGPIAVRYPRDHGRGVAYDGPPMPLEIGKAEVVVQGEDVALFGIGSMVAPCVTAAESLAADGIKAWVVNARFVKPLDQGLLGEIASRVPLAVTVEENVVSGGFGSAVGEMLREKGISTPLVTLGLPDRFVGHGRRVDLLDEVGLTSEGIVEAVKRRLSKCR
jgi:1-deoxy-D-xylulose-5-phosphate synthase